MKTILVDAIDAFVTEAEGIFEELHNLLETYPNNKILLTGANDEQIIKFGLNNMPYEVFTLKHNPEKTDPAYFIKMLASHNLNADEVIYFEHNSEAVKSAESVGIKSYYYDNSKRDLNSLKNFIILSF